MSGTPNCDSNLGNSNRHNHLYCIWDDEQRSWILNWFYFSVFIYLVPFLNLRPTSSAKHLLTNEVCYLFCMCSAKEWKKKHKPIVRQKIDFPGLQRLWLFPVVIYAAVKRCRCWAVLYSTVSAHEGKWTTCDGNMLMCVVYVDVPLKSYL